MSSDTSVALRMVHLGEVSALEGALLPKGDHTILSQLRDQSQTGPAKRNDA